MAWLEAVRPGPDDASLLRAGLQRYAEDRVPESCKKRSYQEDGKIYVPIATKECVLAITGKPAAHQFTMDDWRKVVNWWSKNSEDTGTASWTLTRITLNNLIGTPLGSFPTGENIYDAGNWTDPITVANDVFAWLTRPDTWLAIGSIVVGAGLFVFGARRWIDGMV